MLKRSPKSFEANAKECIQCQRQSDTWRCDACEKILAQEEFDKDVLGNAKKYKRQAVCVRCSAQGFSPRDVQPYPCVECGEKGHMKFPREGLKDYKRRGGKLVCQECSARQRRIEEKLKEKKSIRCTCRGQQHSYSNEKCKLYPGRAGEKLWPGQNNEVSEDDWHFVERMRKRAKR